MPKWIIGLLVAATTFAVLASFAALRMASSRQAPVGQNLEASTGPGGTIYAPPPGTNAAQVGPRDVSGNKTFTSRPGLENYAIPRFSLVNQDAQDVDQTLLEGEISVVAFIFTNCQVACPAITANMKRAFAELEGTPVRFVSISVDPEHDTPEQLRKYAERMAIDTSRWTFLTGTPGETARVVAESMKFEISPDEDADNTITLADGSTMRNILHPIKLFLVGPDRQILDLCSPIVPAELDRFIALARKAAE